MEQGCKLLFKRVINWFLGALVVSNMLGKLQCLHLAQQIKCYITTASIKCKKKPPQSGDHLVPRQKNSPFLEVSKTSALAWEMSTESMKLKFKPLLVHSYLICIWKIKGALWVQASMELKCSNICEVATRAGYKTRMFVACLPQNVVVLNVRAAG